MTARPARVLRGLAVGVLALAWVVAAHLGSAGIGDPDLNVAIGVAPIVLAAWLACSRLAALLRHLARLALAIGLFFIWPGLRDNVSVLYLMQHVGINLSLAALFGLTLSGPGDALITRLARMLHERPLSARNIRYTRQVTLAWTVFFTVNALISLIFHAFLPVAWWSLYANVLNWPLVGAMFLVEHLLRRRILPPEERPSIADVIRVWRRHNAPPAA
jgi:uncharacterized membrane protein